MNLRKKDYQFLMVVGAICLIYIITWKPFILFVKSLAEGGNDAA